MDAIFDRSCFEPGGLLHSFHDGKCRVLPREVAYVIAGEDSKYVTWEELMAKRREWQARHLEFIRRPAEPRVVPCYVWTFFNRQDIPYHGWYCYIVTRQFDFAVNFRGLRHELAESIMRAVPLGLLPLVENFERWMEALAENFPRKIHPNDPRPAGSCMGWISDRRLFTKTRPGR